MVKPGNAPDDARTGCRADGGATRERLMRSGMRLFASQGFAGTSTRELAQAAGVNIAAISYYFGDKAGLYRAVFFEPLGDPQANVASFADASLGLEGALRGFYATFLAPLLMGEDGMLCVKLRMREMVDPTGLWRQKVDEVIRPMHEALAAVICRHLGLAEADDEVQRLVICISALGVHLHLGHEVIDAITPQLNQAPDAVARWADCLLRQAMAMVDQERRRRAAQAQPTLTVSTTPTTPNAVQP
jgi:AcrR family transcriptional regulator